MIAFRYLLVFILPTMLAVALEVATSSMRIEAFHEAVKIIDLTFSKDAEIKKQALESIGSDEGTKLSTKLDRFFAAAVPLGCMVLALAIPMQAKPERIIDFMTTLFCGFCVAFWLIGFYRMEWFEFGLCLLLGIALAAVTLLVRTRLINTSSQYQANQTL
ncbi:hypothetical protein [Shimia sp. MIT1388]|uniref:hypothetical protein n=1 Tax=Shimia sp. MIT1388 TaxID=3096992 RepID=UPI00399AD80C